ncbi:4-diphosphocytidyl-2C-methyl-D-erythritol synthase [Actinoplanes ianthinogenes]|uniref:4-diphosphocytidyl-2C-methyl-D-erythritol synthase n=1 Tax=Actinoplanes ianthinogenes TaxID=122358 RepID=A0ABM7LRT9_9ACTN|nr:nucleotidyltransferase family protein [Actinoplanes ianthinogenes]BCJ41979.1 4-diphosphocytidyl-2C-methyl-D-erythritol synthase [Actinoplanes ianthinogenes]GGR38493.1 4-diphosphocytidyl-2C-methyl-D-erythritol synthase [Actinoplanes ianthinogenes]
MITAGLVLAAGAGRRYGMPKALVPYGKQMLVERAVETLGRAGCERILVVLGARAEEVVRKADLPQVVVNPDWASGMGSSLRAGLAALSGEDAVVVLLVDMPGVTAEAVRRVTAHAAPDALVMGGYQGRRGHPVLLGREHWQGAAAVATGDRGARDYLRAHEVLVVEVGDIADDTDLDHPGDLDA